MPLWALLIVVILSSGKHSEFRCDGIAAFGSDDGSGEEGAWLASDSAGHVIIETDDFLTFCEARAPGYYQWFGMVHFQKDQKRIEITLTKKPAEAK